MPAIDYEQARAELARLFAIAEARFRSGIAHEVSPLAVDAARTLFASKTQSYREALLGCCLARLLDESVDIRLPYVNQGENAYNGRTLDEKVVNPFLQTQEIPCSKGPFLATFRRNVRFTEETRRGLKDAAGYDAMLTYIDLLRQSGKKEVEELTLLLLQHFIELREAADIRLSQIARLSIEQQRRLVKGLLETPSGGRLPVLLAVALLKSLAECHRLEWMIEWQDINVADHASGAGGDITVMKDGEIHLAVEVTERWVDGSRVKATFNTKIARHGIRDYLFLVTREPSPDALSAAAQYFGQGHEVVFLDIETWIVHVLGTLGGDCRQRFTTLLRDLMVQKNVPASLKARWNALVREILAL